MECKFIRKDDYDDIVYDCSKYKMEWYYEDGTPAENEYNYCPKCGSKIVKTIELEDEEAD